MSATANTSATAPNDTTTVPPPTTTPLSSSTLPSQTSERRCENPDCNVNKLISMVPKRKTTQFISEPSVMEKPMLVNGFTAVFQVDGNSAKLMDIKNPSGDPSTKSIYRIVPNSHVHVVNYVVVDTDESYLKKITDNDPATMQKLLTTQKDSADQMLKKIMSGQGSTATAATTTVVSTINPVGGVNRPMDMLSTPTVPVAKPTNIPLQQTAIATQPVSPVSCGVISKKILPKPPINLPMRMHPNLKITAVASAETVGTSNLNAGGVTTLVSPTPYIQPVPLASLQTPSAVAQVSTQIPKPSTTITVKPPVAPPSAIGEVPDKYVKILYVNVVFCSMLFLCIFIKGQHTIKCRRKLMI